MTLDILIRSREDAENLNREVGKTGANIWVHADRDMIMVDARSLLGLCAIAGMPAKLVAEDDFDPKTLAKIARRAGVNVA